jgi:hypothetical protein
MKYMNSSPIYVEACTVEVILYLHLMVLPYYHLLAIAYLYLILLSMSTPRASHSSIEHSHDSLLDNGSHRSSTLPFENLKDIDRIALSPNGTTLISIDVDGRALLINFFKR